MKYYRIRDWDEHFEIAQTRKVVHAMRFVCLPTKHDGKSFRRIMRRPDGPAIFAAWVLIVEIAAKCPTRGVLADVDGPLTAEDLWLKTDCPEEVFAEALEFLASSKVGWLVAEEWEDRGSTVGARSQSSGRTVPTTEPDPTEPEPTEPEPTEPEPTEPGQDRTDPTEPEQDGADSESARAGPSDSDFGSDDTERRKAYGRWGLGVSEIWSPDAKQREADKTCTLQLFDEHVYPADLTNGEGSRRVSAALKLVPKAKPKRKPMGWFTDMVRKGGWR